MIHISCWTDYSLWTSFKMFMTLVKTRILPKGYSFITADKLLDQLQSGIEYTIVDCRGERVFREIGHIDGAINCPSESFENLSNLVPKDRPIVTACYFGFVSQIAAQKLAAMGYKNIHSMKGGMEKWIGSNKPIKANK